MFTYKKLAVLALVLILGVPSVSMAGSFVVSLVQGKTPAEAVQIIAEQIDLLTGRVATLEDKQAALEADVSKNKSTTELEIERLNAENENLRLKADEAFTGTAQIRANEARKAQCAELGAQLGTKENAVRAPFETRIKPIQDEIRTLQVQLVQPAPQQTVATGASSDIDANRASIAAAQEIKAQIKTKQSEIGAIRVEMEKALDILHAIAEVKTLQDNLNALLCA